MTRYLEVTSDWVLVLECYTKNLLTPDITPHLFQITRLTSYMPTFAAKNKKPYSDPESRLQSDREDI